MATKIFIDGKEGTTGLRIYDRLAAYENTGLEPKEIAELQKQNDLLAQYGAQKLNASMADFKEINTLKLKIQYLEMSLCTYTQAKQDGRLVVLPCKVGTPVYTTRWWDEVPETCIDSKGKKFQRMTTKHKVTKEEFSPFSLDYVQFGEKVFLTREEAERALEGGKDNA